MILRVIRTPQAVMPTYATRGSAGMDLSSIVDCIIEPGERKLISTGLSIALPKGYEAQIRSRSGLSLKYGVVVLNSPGTIDSDYRGEVGVILINLGSQPFHVAVGDRIAQMVIAQCHQAQVIEVETLDITARNNGGFGSTGK